MMEKLSNDNLEFYKKFAVKILSELAPSAPVEKETIISVLVNKLGDGDKKVACHVIYVVGNMVNRDPSLGVYVIRAVSLLLTRAVEKP